ncbi:MAG: hypothetical protein EAZ27_00160 [Cytophagales bacterium]|nr:MAG: hypothetical protein EAZ27_00160 [Cytophagales bacterium]
MNPNEFIKMTFSFLVFVLLHVLLFKYFVLADIALCFLYIGFILTISISFPVPILLLIGFFTGFFVDLFYDTIGIHIAATTLVIFIKPKFVSLLMPLGGYDDVNEISIQTMGIRRFATYCFFVILIHTFIVFFMEAYGFSIFHITLLKTFFSSIFTTLMVVIFQFIFFTKKI